MGKKEDINSAVSRLAEKKSRLKLLKKAQAGQKLTAPERAVVAEAVAGDAERSGIHKYPLSAAAVKLLAFEGKTIAEAEGELQLADNRLQKAEGRGRIKKRNLKSQISNLKSLNEVFVKQPCLKQAWERGRFLLNIAEFGGKNYTISEAEGELGLTAGQLEQIFLKDIEAADTWNQARLKTLLAIKSKWLEMVGQASPAALKQIEKLMRREIAHQAADLTHITSKQMQELTGYVRQSVEYEWTKNYGLPRNSDGTYNLFKFVPWFEEFTKKKTNPQRDENPAQNEKARKYKLENDERIGKLLDRDKVIAGLAARNQTIMRVFAKALAEQKDPFIKQTLERTFEDIRRELAGNTIEMKLTEKQSANLKKLLEEISAETTHHPDTDCKGQSYRAGSEHEDGE